VNSSVNTIMLTMDGGGTFLILRCPNVVVFIPGTRESGHCDARFTAGTKVAAKQPEPVPCYVLGAVAGRGGACMRLGKETTRLKLSGELRFCPLLLFPHSSRKGGYSCPPQFHPIIVSSKPDV
jgi:hypothetical protein